MRPVRRSQYLVLQVHSDYTSPMLPAWHLLLTDLVCMSEVRKHHLLQKATAVHGHSWD